MEQIQYKFEVVMSERLQEIEREAKERVDFMEREKIELEHKFNLLNESV